MGERQPARGPGGDAPESYTRQWTDLFKWAYKLSPAVPGELLADCLDLAGEIRELDMRASPYDLRDLGYEPVAIETAEGRAEYVAAQRGFAERGAVLRARLIEVCDRLLAGS